MWRAGCFAWMLLLPSLGLGRLAETVEQCFDRYGNGKKETPAILLIAPLKSSEHFTFTSGEWRIRFTFIPASDGKRYAVAAQYSRKEGGALEDYEVSAILQAESAGKQWRRKGIDPTGGDTGPVAQALRGLLRGDELTREDGATARWLGSCVVLELPAANLWRKKVQDAEDARRRAAQPNF